MSDRGELILINAICHGWGIIGALMFGRVGHGLPRAVYDPAVRGDVQLNSGHDHTAPWQLLLLVAIINPLYEETFVAAYNIQALHHRGPELAIGISTAIRVSYHLCQGPSAIFPIGLFGVICGAVYWRWRTAWPLVVMHAIADAFAFAR